LTKSSSAFAIAMAPPKSGEKQVPVSQSKAKTKVLRVEKELSAPVDLGAISTLFEN
jgi:hypothetical protein